MEDKEGSPFFFNTKEAYINTYQCGISEFVKTLKNSTENKKTLCVFVCVCVRKFVQKRT